MTVRALALGRLPAPGSSGRPPVHWHEGGVEHAPTLLLVNGWTASGLVWPRAWLDRLEQHYRVIRVDNRGSGWSRSAPAPYTIADLADDAAAVLRLRRAAPATVLGLSMGGMVAQEVAYRHPRLVARLLLVGTRPASPQHLPMSPDELHAALRRRDEGQSWPTFIAGLWARQCAPGFALRHPETMEEIVAQTLARPTPRAGVLGQARAVAAWSPRGLLAGIRAPTLVVHGALDPMMPVGNGVRLARGIAGAKYVQLPGVGHLVPHEAPEALLEHLLPPRSDTWGPNQEVHP